MPRKLGVLSPCPVPISAGGPIHPVGGTVGDDMTRTSRHRRLCNMRNASRVVLETVASTPNPFRYGSPVTGANFTGRTVERQALVSGMSDGLNVSLVSPRRYGKTSLLLRAEGTII